MKNENKPTHDKHEHAANMSWLRVLDFSSEVINAKANEQPLPANVSAFIVLP